MCFNKLQTNDLNNIFNYFQIFIYPENQPTACHCLQHCHQSLPMDLLCAKNGCPGWMGSHHLSVVIFWYWHPPIWHLPNYQVSGWHHHWMSDAVYSHWLIVSLSSFFHLQNQTNASIICKLKDSVSTLHLTKRYSSFTTMHSFPCFNSTKKSHNYLRSPHVRDFDWPYYNWWWGWGAFHQAPHSLDN